MNGTLWCVALLFEIDRGIWKIQSGELCRSRMLTWGVHGCGSGWGGRAGAPRACRAPPRRAGGRASESARRESWPCCAGCRRPPPRSRRAREAAGSSETARVSGRGRRRRRCSDCCRRRSEAAGVMMSECRLRSRAGDLCRRAFPWKALEIRKAGVSKRARRTRAVRDKVSGRISIICKWRVQKSHRAFGEVNKRWTWITKHLIYNSLSKHTPPDRRNTGRLLETSAVTSKYMLMYTAIKLDFFDMLMYFLMKEKS